MIEEDMDSAEVSENLNNLKEVLLERAESVKLTDKQLENLSNFLELVQSRIERIEKGREDAKRAEDERKAIEQQRIREEELRRQQAESRASVEHARRQMERSAIFDCPVSPSLSDNEEPNDEPSDNDTPTIDDQEIVQPSSNMPKVDFLSFINSGGAYLMFEKNNESRNVINTLTEDGLKYPLGVAYDEKLQLWLICDRNLDKMVVIDVKKHDFKICDGDGAIRQPTAVIVYREGYNAAVLCADRENPRRQVIYIYNYNLDDPFLQVFASHSDEAFGLNHQLRGLAKSFAGNLLSLEHAGQTKKLRVFKRGVGGQGFVIQGAQSPCFIATYRSTVAVSDLIVNKVFIFNLNDTDWRNISFQMIHVIESPEMPLNHLANVGGFKFVSGMQFDINGHLLIGDAKGHSIKLYDGADYNFLHRISSDFVLPYVSSFHVNQKGECVLLDVQGVKKFHWVKMTSVPSVIPWVSPTERPQRRQDPQHHQPNSRRGGHNRYN